MFKEFYYYIYEIHTGKESENIKFFSSLSAISYFQGINIISILGCCNYFTNITIGRNAAIILGLTIFIILNVLNYYFLYRKRNEIKEKVEKFSPKRERIGKTIFAIYILCSLLILFYTVKNFAPVRG